MGRRFYQETSHPGVGISFGEGQAIMMGSGQAWTFTSNSERGQDLPKVTYHTSANPGLGLDPWILTRSPLLPQ